MREGHEPRLLSAVPQAFPENFARTAALARELGTQLERIDNKRIFIDEIPADWPTVEPIVPACDFLCHLAEMDMEAA
jgi:hypothetical protein